MLRRVRERDARFADVAQPAFRIPVEAAREQAPDDVGRARRQPLPLGLARDDGRERVRDCLLVEQPRPRQHLEEHDAEGPHVSALVDGTAPRLFGTHVPRGPENHARHGLRRREHGGRRRGVRQRGFRSGGEVEGLREPEVEDLHRTVVADLDVGRLEIAMDDALLVRGLERVRNLARNRERLLRRRDLA